MVITAKANKIQKPRVKGILPRRPDQKPPPKPFPLLALDTETTGLDHVHGCRPFFVSTCNEEGKLQYWEWDVDPLTRIVSPPKNELAELTKVLGSHAFVLHNTKFDFHMLESLGLPLPAFARCHDTLVSSHVLYSNEPHGLKELALRYLDILDDDESELQDATNAARRIARNLDWAIASGPHEHFPAMKSAPKEGWWKMDTWLPRAVAKYMWEEEKDITYAPHCPNCEGKHSNSCRVCKGDNHGHPWWTVLRRYALRDVERTMGLYWLFMEQLEKQDLMSQYLERKDALAAIYRMECNGVTVNEDRMWDVTETIVTESEELKDRCFEISSRAPEITVADELSEAELAGMSKAQVKAALRKSQEVFVFDNLNSPKQLERLLFDAWGLENSKRTKSDNRATDNEVIKALTERAKGDPQEFCKCLSGFRKRDKALAYINEYRTRSTQLEKDWLILRGNFNLTGTDTTRLSSSGPNFQNISKREHVDDEGISIVELNLRRLFGPAPGRIWYSADYSNIELRIFAWKSGDEDLINAFNEGYSVHLIFAELLYKKQWQECLTQARRNLINSRTAERVGTTSPVAIGISPKELQKAAGSIFKKLYESTWYQWVKNGNFSLIYGAGKARADKTYHCPGAYDLIRNRMPLIDDFLNQKHHEASVKGYITTLGGYRLYVPIHEPHKAVNYYVQGSAGWFMVTALNRVHRYLEELNRRLNLSQDKCYKMIMTVHDELVFDFPDHPRNETEVVPTIARLMAQSGEPYDIPTPVEFERHIDNWAEGVKLNLEIAL